MLGDLYSCMERVCSVPGKHRHTALAQDPPGIDPFIHKVNRTTGLGDASLQSLTPCLQSPKGGEKGWVDVQDPAGKNSQQWFLDDPHVSGEHDEIDLHLPENPDDLLLGLRGHPGPEWPGRHEMVRQPMLLRELKDA